MAPLAEQDFQSGRRYLIAAAATLALPASILAVQSLVGDTLVTLLLVGILVLLALPFVRGLLQGDLNLLEPVVVVSFLLAIAYPLQVLVPILFEGYSSISLKVLYWEDHALLRESLFYVALGVATYLGAYYRAPQTLLQLGRTVGAGARITRWEWRIMGVALIGWGVRLYLVATGNYATFYKWSGHDPSTGALFLAISQLAWFAYVLAWVHWFRGGRSAVSLALAAGLTLGEGSFHLIISASKLYLAYLLVFPIMAAYLCRKRVPLLPLAGFGLALLLVVFPFVMQLRELQEGWQPETTDPGLQVEMAYKILENRFSLETFSNDESALALREYFFLRFGGFESLAVVLTEVPENADYLYFHDLLLLPLALVPRIVLPWKPESLGVQTFSDQVYQGGGGVSIYPIGDGYYNFGALGVVLLMGSWGLFHRWYYDSFFKPREKNPFVMAAFIYLLFTVTNLDEFIEMRYVALVQHAAILGVVYLLLFRNFSLGIFHKSTHS